MSRTGPEVAAIAGRGLAKGKRGVSDEEFRDVCASALRQFEAVGSYTDLKKRAAKLKRQLTKGTITPPDALNALVEMVKPVSIKPDAPKIA